MPQQSLSPSCVKKNPYQYVYKKENAT